MLYSAIIFFFGMLKKQQQENVQNPLDGLFQEDLQQFVSYEKKIDEKYKSRQTKTKERIQKLFLHIQQQRKQKRKQRRQMEKKKLHDIIDKMTENEARIYLDGIKAAKKQKKDKVRQAMKTGQVIILDLVYEAKMNTKQNKSLGSQIELIMKAIKHVDNPPSIHLCNFKDGIKTHLEKMRYQHWALTPHEQDLSIYSKLINQKIIYLSPDAPLALETLEPNDVFVLGGLIDRTILKNASLARANQLGIQARRLPINQYMKGRVCLNLDHVVSMLCKFKQTKDWKIAFDFAAPKRWKKQQGQKDQNSEEGFEISQ